MKMLIVKFQTSPEALKNHQGSFETWTMSSRIIEIVNSLQL